MLNNNEIGWGMGRWLFHCTRYKAFKQHNQVTLLSQRASQPNDYRETTRKEGKRFLATSVQACNAQRRTRGKPVTKKHQNHKKQPACASACTNSVLFNSSHAFPNHPIIASSKASVGKPIPVTHPRIQSTTWPEKTFHPLREPKTHTMISRTNTCNTARFKPPFARDNKHKRSMSVHVALLDLSLVWFTLLESEIGRETRFQV